MSLTTDAPADLLACHPETAYFWGRVAADGDCTPESVTVRAADETAARRLASIAGAETVDHRIRERDYAHDTSLTRCENEFVVQAFGDLGERAAAAFGLPVDGSPGGYRLDVLADYDRPLVRGLLEGCGTVCYSESEGTVGISFVHDDRSLLDTVETLLADAPVPAETGAVSETSSGGHWFSVADEHVPAVAEWVYDGSADTGLFAPSRRRKLRRSVERATGDDGRAAGGAE